MTYLAALLPVRPGVAAYAVPNALPTPLSHNRTHRAYRSDLSVDRTAAGGIAK